MVRKVITRSPHREVGVVNPAWLLNHAVHHESHLERRFIMGALACPVVTDIVHQPREVVISDPDEPKRRVYTPDFKVGFRDGASLFIEVKPQTFVQKHAKVLDLAGKKLLQEGHRFAVITDQEIDGNELGARAMLLMRYGRMQFDDSDAMACLRQLNDACHGSASIRELIAQGLSEVLIWHLVARHQCRVPADFTLDADQVVSTHPIEGNCHDYFLTWFGAQTR